MTTTETTSNFIDEEPEPYVFTEHKPNCLKVLRTWKNRTLVTRWPELNTNPKFGFFPISSFPFYNRTPWYMHAMVSWCRVLQ